MDYIGVEELELLLKDRSGPCVSIFMPAHRGAAENSQDRIRLKNLLKESDKKITACDLGDSKIGSFLVRAESLFKDNQFWEKQQDGLAVFMAPDLFKYYCLPLPFKELVVASRRFHIKPILPLLKGDDVFYILTLSQKRVRFLEGTQYSCQERDLAGVPGNLEEALGYDVHQKQVQFHTAAPGEKGARSMVFHGQAMAEKENKAELARYFRLIDEGLHSRLKDKKDPLVLAGVEYLFPIYRGVNTYSGLMAEGIPGNPDGLSLKELHERARSIVDSHRRKEEEESLSLYRKLAGTGKASGDLESIASAAGHGRVEFVFVAEDRIKWGAVDRENEKIHLRPEPEAGDEDILNYIAIQVLAHGGAVYAIDSGQIPGGEPAAAVFRY